MRERERGKLRRRCSAIRGDMRILKDILHALIFKGALLKKINFCIQTTNICNANCIFCGYSKYKDKREVMTYYNFSNIIKNIATMNITSINFTSAAGEPLTDKNLPQKIQLAKESGYEITISTNAEFLIKNENFKKIIEHNVDCIQISTPGLDRKAYERVFNIKNYDDVLNGIIAICQYKKQTRSNTYIALSARRDRSFHELLNDIDYINNIKQYVDEGIATFDEGYVKFDSFCGLVKNTDLTGIMTLAETNEICNKYCSRILTDIAILADGSVRLCSCRHNGTQHDDLVIGNIKDNTLKDILKGKKIRMLYLKELFGTIPNTCVGCTYKNFNPNHE